MKLADPNAYYTDRAVEHTAQGDIYAGIPLVQATQTDPAFQAAGARKRPGGPDPEHASHVTHVGLAVVLHYTCGITAQPPGTAGYSHEHRLMAPVTTRLAWETIAPEDFERLIFNLLTSTAAYENVTWDMRTNAPDRGRDVAAYRVAEDPLSGVQRRRVAVQCKHWLTKSVGPTDVAKEVASIKLWDNPPVDVLIIATSGRFTMDAVSWIEKHNSNREHPTIEQWPESHLESLLAQRPNLVAEFNLRPE